ncbi:MAG: 16S rRNA (guanine(966)-N(2))-methyltransferase RsmD [Actinobacteria bacterium]|nr:16S rRNA (guanine(966)-N(2))-methyltransferase RsmD [Actinomycetota bacterium]
MRVIAGKAKGRKLKCKKGLSTRPMTNRIKKMVFDTLSNKVVDAYILDLYAGSGSLGIEALSRGGKRAVFIEKDYTVANFLKQNIINTSFKDVSDVFIMDVAKSINILANKKLKFNIIFCDPPYKINEVRIKNILEKIVKSELLTMGGELIYHHSKRISFSEIFKKLKLIKDTKVGESVVSFYRYI